jgi:hypothetical protein
MSKTPNKNPLASQRKFQTNSALAGETGGLHGNCMKHERRAYQESSLVIFAAASATPWNGGG